MNLFRIFVDFLFSVHFSCIRNRTNRPGRFTPTRLLKSQNGIGTVSSSVARSYLSLSVPPNGFCAAPDLFVMIYKNGLIHTFPVLI